MSSVNFIPIKEKKSKKIRKGQIMFIIINRVTLVRFAHNCNNGTIEYWNIGFWDDSSLLGECAWQKRKKTGNFLYKTSFYYSMYREKSCKFWISSGIPTSSPLLQRGIEGDFSNTARTFWELTKILNFLKPF